MQSLAGVGVEAVRVDHEDVLGLQAGERDARVGEDLVGVELLSVQRDLAHVACDQVDEGDALRRRGEPDDAAGAEDLRTLRQVERDFVRLGVDDVAALLRFDAGEVLSRAQLYSQG